MSAIGHPIFGDRASGTQIAWQCGLNEFEILTWNGFSSTRGNYDGFYSRWRVDHKQQSIHFVTAASRRRVAVGETWWEDSAGSQPKPLDFVDLPESHTREARRIGREIFGKRRFNALMKE
jgi:hypothetical protein